MTWISWLTLSCPSALRADWYRPGAALEYPVGGSGALIDALVRGLRKRGGALRLRSHVAQILVEGAPGSGTQRAAGVRLRGGGVLRARKAVISNASIWDTLPLLPPGALPADWAAAEGATEQCASFMHLHLGIDATGLDPKELQIHHISVEDWDRGVTSPQNLVLVSIPSVLDPGMAPPGCHVIHAYTPGTEPSALWAGLEVGSDAYRQLKEERAAVLWRAVEKAIPDVRRRVKIEMVGTPRTHARFLRRQNGTYGGTGWVGGGGAAGGAQGVPAADTPLPGLLCVGDSRFPGPGVPAVAAGGLAAAHALASPLQQCATLDKVAPWFAPL
jgi:phytoene dehydrogenase-like protein